LRTKEQGSTYPDGRRNVRHEKIDPHLGRIVLPVGRVINSKEPHALLYHYSDYKEAFIYLWHRPSFSQQQSSLPSFPSVETIFWAVVVVVVETMSIVTSMGKKNLSIPNLPVLTSF